MKRLALLLALPFLLAAEKPWPQKGDTVYLAAELHEHTPALPLMGGAPDVDLAACVPLTKTSKSQGGAFFGEGFKDDRGNHHGLAGDWSALLHRTAEECKKAVAANGLPRVKSQGVRHRLAE